MAKKKRTILEIVKHYADDLHKKGLINQKEHDYHSNTKEGQSEVLELLLERLYEREEINGQEVSTVNSFFHFCEYVLHKDPASGQKIWNNFLKKLFVATEHNQLTAIMAARGHGKSFYASALYPLFKAYLYPFFDTVLVSNIPSQTKRNFRVLKRLIESNELLSQKIDYDGNEKRKWTETEISYNNGYLEGISIGSSPRSAHVKYVVGDDPLRDDAKYSDAYYKNFFLAQLLPIIQRYKGRMVVVGCITKDSIIKTKKGYKKIGDVFDWMLKPNGQYDLNLEVKDKDNYVKTKKFHKTPITKTIKIKTNAGIELEGTPNHMIKVLENSEFVWKRLDNITKKDYVVLVKDNHFGNFFEKLSYLLGFYVAEGNIENEYRLTLTNSEFGYIKKIYPDIDFKSYDGLHYKINSKDFVSYFQNKLGVKKQKCYEKTTPEKVWEFDRPSMKNYLSGLFDGDGSIDKKTGRISLVSTSKTLLKETQQILLSSFGIISKIYLMHKKGHLSKKCGKSKHASYKLVVIPYYTGKFIKNIGFKNPRKNKISLKFVNKYDEGKDKIPNIHDFIKQNTKTKGLSEYLYGKKKHTITRKRLNKLKLPKKDFMDKKYYYDVVKEISTDKNITFDFVIPETHSFISNGMINHNTPMHFEDLFHTIMSTKVDGDEKVPVPSGDLIEDGKISALGFYSEVFKAMDPETGEILLPEIFSARQLEMIKNTQGEIFFQREYMCECVADKTAVFPWTLIKRCTKETEETREFGKEEGDYFIGVDVATSGSASADYSAFIVLEAKYMLVEDYDSDGNEVKKEKLVKIVRHIEHTKGMPIDEQIRKIEELSKRFNDAYVLVEKNNVGVALTQKLRYNGTNIGEFITSRFKKENAIRLLVSDMKQGKFILPKNGRNISKLKDELTKFGVKIIRTRSGSSERMQALSGHDDLVMALVIANQAVEDMGTGATTIICQD